MTTHSTSRILLDAVRGLDGYDFLREVHCGGQGVVYQAVQQSTGQDVAIKFLRHGVVSTPQQHARLEREVQILGQLQHPHIVMIHDSGVVDGLPYFVMDYIDGDPLDTFVLRESLSVRESIQIVIQVCEAVQAAHVRGVIHRDLKPANILIDAEGSPHVVDFGLAKYSDDSSDATAVTQTGQFIGSLPWAAPEQLSGDAAGIDLRTDVYALGVILYQLLTGRLPYDLQGPPAEVASRIANSDPVSLRSLRQDLDDEIDTITLKCIAKEPERRYQSSGELAQELTRYLDGEPILAKPPSLAYFLKKKLRRHRTAAIAALALLVAITAGLASTSVGIVWALQERDRAESQARTAEEERDRAGHVVAFMKTMLSGATPNIAQGRDDALLREMLDEALTRLKGDELAAAPQARIELLATIAEVFNHLADYERASETASFALELAEELGPDGDRGRALVLPGLAMAELLGGSIKDAGTYAKQGADLARRVLSEDDPARYDAIEVYATYLQSRTKWAAAEKQYWEVYEGKSRILGPDDANTLTTLMNLGKPIGRQGRIEEAIDVLRRARDGLQEHHGKDHPVAASANGHLAYAFLMLGKLEEAETHYRESIATNTRVRGPEHLGTLYGRSGLAGLLKRMNRLPEAEQEYREVWELAKSVYGHAQVTGQVSFELGVLLHGQERYADATPFFRLAVEVWDDLVGPVHLSSLFPRSWLALNMHKDGDLEGADAAFTDLIPRARKLPKLPPGNLTTMIVNAGKCARDLGRFERGDALFREAYESALSRNDERVCSTIAELLVALNEQWHESQPDEGHDVQAREWQAKVAEYKEKGEEASD